MTALQTKVSWDIIEKIANKKQSLDLPRDSAMNTVQRSGSLIFLDLGFENNYAFSFTLFLSLTQHTCVENKLARTKKL